MQHMSELQGGMQHRRSMLRMRVLQVEVQRMSILRVSMQHISAVQVGKVVHAENACIGGGSAAYERILRVRLQHRYAMLNMRLLQAMLEHRCCMLNLCVLQADAAHVHHAKNECSAGRHVAQVRHVEQEDAAGGHAAKVLHAEKGALSVGPLRSRQRLRASGDARKVWLVLSFECSLSQTRRPALKPMLCEMLSILCGTGCLGRGQSMPARLSIPPAVHAPIYSTYLL